jgi:malate dehydrogenase
MPFIAIIGAGPLGSALAHKLAARNRVPEIRMIDVEGSVARGKALDILQSGPIENFSAVVTATDSLHAAAGAAVIAIADAAAGPGEHTGEAALGIVRKLRDAGIRAPLVFTGATQREAMSRAISELRVPSNQVVGTSALALESAIRTMCGVIADTSPLDVSLAVAGVPPKHAVVGWQEAAIAGQPLASVLGPHEIAAIASRIPGLWPPGPYALGSAAARVVEALVDGSRRRYSCFVDVGRGRIAAMPVELEPGGIKRVLQLSLTTQEQTVFDNALSL